MNPHMRSLVALTPRPNVRRVHPLDVSQRLRPVEQYEQEMVEEPIPVTHWGWRMQLLFAGVSLVTLTCWGIFLYWVIS